jgi:hypothetical protein
MGFKYYNMCHVFISYKQDDDTTFMDLLLEKLSAAHIDVWHDVDILPGENWSDRIDIQIDRSCALMVVLTEHAVKSDYITYEWSRAIGKDVPVFPLLRTKGIKIHSRLDKFQYIDFSDKSIPKSAWEQLITLLENARKNYEGKKAVEVAQQSLKVEENQSNKVADALTRVFDTYVLSKVTPRIVVDELARAKLLPLKKQTEIFDLVLKDEQKPPEIGKLAFDNKSGDSKTESDKKDNATSK